LSAEKRLLKAGKVPAQELADNANRAELVVAHVALVG
jgi:hypothetical protein